jgi:hypothetical protein
MVESYPKILQVSTFWLNVCPIALGSCAESNLAVPCGFALGWDAIKIVKRTSVRFNAAISRMLATASEPLTKDPELLAVVRQIVAPASKGFLFT